MKNADEMLKKTLKEVDTNGDGKIQYEGTVAPLSTAHGVASLVYSDSDVFFSYRTEFRTFCQRAERQLFDLFSSIDTDGDGKLDKKELQTAFRSAGLTVSGQRLSNFFQEMDHNNDGYVTFNEWRYVGTFDLASGLSAGCAFTGGARFPRLQLSSGALACHVPRWLEMGA